VERYQLTGLINAPAQYTVGAYNVLWLQCRGTASASSGSMHKLQKRLKRKSLQATLTRLQRVL